jgi:aldehyde dehydrogenase (NAD(P)+)
MSTAVEMSGAIRSQKTTDQKELDQGLAVLKDKAREFARLPIKNKIALLRDVLERMGPVSEGWVKDGCKAKGIPEGSALMGEEWLAGPVVTARNVRLLIRSLEGIERTGKPELDQKMIRRRNDGRVEVKIFPTDAMDAALFAGFTISELMMPGMGGDEVRARQASFYSKKDPEGGVSLVLGAGNVSSIPPMDALYKWFCDGHVVMLKMNPVNEWVGPHLERAFEPFIKAGYLRIAYGGGDVGKYLVERPEVTDIHITGSNHTHDLIVWGPAGPERDRRIAAKDPLLKKTITSELGNVSPVTIVPGDYSEGELDFMARNIVSMVTNNGSFNCNAGKVIVTSSGWAQKAALFSRMEEIFKETPTRLAYYPGAEDRYNKLIEGRDAKKIGTPGPGHLPWTFIRNVDSKNANDPIFSTEPFCSIISETSIDAKDAADFIEKSAVFMNDRLWGTLNATILIPPKVEAVPEVSEALEKAIVDLRYGTVAINHWPALVYGTVSPAWGGHPSGTLENVQSGIGWVHNSYLLEGIEKTILRGPFVVKPKPPWFVGHKKVDALGRRLLDVERNPSWLKIPGIAITALGG